MRTRLIKQGIKAGSIHGHHIVQKTVPWRYLDDSYTLLDEATQSYKPLKRFDLPLDTWKPADQSAWYIGNTQEKLPFQV